MGERDAVIEKVYINQELRAFNVLDHDLKIPFDSGKEICVFGTFNPGCKFEIKVIFESGYTLRALEKY